MERYTEMKSKIILELNKYEAARLNSLVRDGKRILKHQVRTQRGIDGYTYSDLNKIEELLGIVPQSEFADGDLF